MIKTLIKISCVASVLITPNLLLAADTASQGVETKGSAANNQPSVKDGADKTSSANTMGAAMSYLTGGMLITKGYEDITIGTAPCPSPKGCNWSKIVMGVMEVSMGVLSLAQGAAHNSAAGQANITGIQTDGFGMDMGAGSLDPMDPRNPNGLGKDPAIKAAFGNLAKLEKEGILNMKKGTITAGGKTFKISDFSSAEGMAAAGIPKGAIDGAMALAAAVSKKASEKFDKLKLGAMTASSGFDEGGGGAGSGGAVVVEEDFSGAGRMAGAGGIGGGIGSGRDPSSLAGMQKNYNGEPIGVAADSIFMMMNRRYKVKESQESFFTDAELALQK